MPYPEQLCAPMRQELTGIGFTELKDAQQVDASIPNSQGTLLLIVNSVCGCAAGSARPAVKLALTKSEIKPDSLVTVFAGQEVEAVAAVRSLCHGFAPSSPAIAFFKGGAILSMIERRDIEGFNKLQIAEKIAKHCEGLA